MTLSLLWSVRFQSPDVLFSNMKKEIEISTLNITNYLSNCIFDKQITTAIIPSKQKQNTITIPFYIQYLCFVIFIIPA